MAEVFAFLQSNEVVAVGKATAIDELLALALSWIVKPGVKVKN